MSTLGAELPTPEAAECFDMVDRLARLLKADGDPRPIGQLRTVVLSDLIRRPWDTTRPPMAAQLTIVATLAGLAGRSAEAGEVNGLAITAAHVRQLLAELDALGLRTPAGGSLTVAVTGPDGELLATVTPAQLQRLARRGCPRHPADPADISAGECACPVLDRPPATAAYEPTDAQRMWVTTRDRTCRFPNCGQRVGWADLDHVVPHACGGDTACTNLCCLCRSHHRLKTRRTDWAFTMNDDGTLTVTTPSGITRTTCPPGMRTRPAESREPASGKESTREPEPYPPVASGPEDDPPPF
jgi:hypothetical protein